MPNRLKAMSLDALILACLARQTEAWRELFRRLRRRLRHSGWRVASHFGPRVRSWVEEEVTEVLDSLPDGAGGLLRAYWDERQARPRRRGPIADRKSLEEFLARKVGSRLRARVRRELRGPGRDSVILEVLPAGTELSDEVIERVEVELLGLLRPRHVNTFLMEAFDLPRGPYLREMSPATRRQRRYELLRETKRILREGLVPGPVGGDSTADGGCAERQGELMGGPKPAEAVAKGGYRGFAQRAANRLSRPGDGRWWIKERIFDFGRQAMKSVIRCSARLGHMMHWVWRTLANVFQMLRPPTTRSRYEGLTSMSPFFCPLFAF